MRFFPKGFAAFFTLMILTAGQLGAHVFSAFFDSSQPFSVSGTIVKVDWVRPNVFVHVRAVDKKTGETVTWAFETMPPNALTGARHVTREMLREGDTVTVIGWKSKPGANWKAAIADPELAARVISEKPACAAQFELADGRKFAVVEQVPTPTLN